MPVANQGLLPFEQLLDSSQMDDVISMTYQNLSSSLLDIVFELLAMCRLKELAGWLVG